MKYIKVHMPSTEWLRYARFFCIISEGDKLTGRLKITIYTKRLDALQRNKSLQPLLTDKKQRSSYSFSFTFSLINALIELLPFK